MERARRKRNLELIKEANKEKEARRNRRNMLLMVLLPSVAFYCGVARVTIPSHEAVKVFKEAADNLTSFFPFSLVPVALRSLFSIVQNTMLFLPRALLESVGERRRGVSSTHQEKGLEMAVISILALLLFHATTRAKLARSHFDEREFVLIYEYCLVLNYILV